jgi:hypothetical protein
MALLYKTKPTLVAVPVTSEIDDSSKKLWQCFDFVVAGLI